ncbi:hypothetical protein SELMODRAFT_235037 [Selaginella moellendorffii]|uniref:U3 small nucleolar ribonucleoprotein protein IMP3 n=1 Tax=Selaginella moellendorffii TaxID=88036 RepID=D8ST37_SELML|nr:hypothetical protein SELMODRAFT_235037 [Selaginella moellendorffii]
MRKLKFHEQRLLKKVNFLEWKRERNSREVRSATGSPAATITSSDYNKICGMVSKLTSILKKLDPKDPFRIQMTDQNMGIIPTKKSLAQCESLAASALCRRRLAVVLVKLHFAENLKDAVTFVEQGHIRVGPDTITDPAFLVRRNMEDFVTWVDTSKIKRKVLQYNLRPLELDHLSLLRR